MEREPIHLGYSQQSRRLVSYRGEPPGIVTFGGPGSGKTSQIITNLLTYNKSTVVFSDVNAELACVTAERRRRFGRVLQINPFRLYCDTYLKDIPCIGYNPMKVLNPKSPKFSVRASKLPPPSVPKNDSARDPYWDNTAFALVHPTIMAEVLKGDSPYLHAVASKLYGNVFEYAAEVMATVEMNEVREKMKRYAGAKADDIKSLKEVIENARTHMDFVLDESIGQCLSKDDSFSFTQLKREVVTVYVILPPDVVGVLGKFFKLILASCLTELFDQESE